MIKFSLIIKFYKIKEVNKVDSYVTLLLMPHFIRIKLTIILRPYKIEKGIFYNHWLSSNL